MRSPTLAAAGQTVPSHLEIAGGWSVILKPALSPLVAPCCLHDQVHTSTVLFLTLLCLCLLSGPGCAELWTILGNISKLGWTPVRPHQFLIWFDQTIVTAVTKMLQNQTERFPTVQSVVNGLSSKELDFAVPDPCLNLYPNCTKHYHYLCKLGHRVHRNYFCTIPSAF